MNKWYDDVRQLRGSDIVIALVGNKIDQKETRFVFFSYLIFLIDVIL